MLFWMHLANFMTALSIGGFSVLGVIESAITYNTLIFSAIVFGAMAFIGRYVDYSINDGDEDDATDSESEEVDKHVKNSRCDGDCIADNMLCAHCANNEKGPSDSGTE
jgi:hypothetical protein